MCRQGLAEAQEQEPIILTESVVTARARVSRALYLRYGTPLVNTRSEHVVNGIADFPSEFKPRLKKDKWISQNEDFDMPNWVAWTSVRDFGAANAIDRTEGVFKEGRFLIGDDLWSALMEEASKWEMESPVGKMDIVVGPVIYKKPGTTMEKSDTSAVPTHYFAAFCKKTTMKLGYKSIAFLIPNKPGQSTQIYAYSISVNTLESLTGFNFFPKLPAALQEIVEEMTTYELFSTFQEISDYNNEPDWDADYQEIMAEMEADMRER